MFGAILSLAVFTSSGGRMRIAVLEDRGSISIHSIVIVNAVVTFLKFS
jgi:hypothetical protein